MLFCTLRQKTETHLFRHWTFGAKVRRKGGGGARVRIDFRRRGWLKSRDFSTSGDICSMFLFHSGGFLQSVAMLNPPCFFFVFFLMLFFFFFSFDELISDETESIFQRGRRKQEGSGGRTLALVSAPR